MIEELAETIIRVLKSQGVIIQRYDAITTNSIYLKLDYGVAKTIRISDHRGKKHLKYRYNLQSNLTKKKFANKGSRLYYHPDEVYIMIRRILKDRAELMKRYGNKYQYFMDKNIAENAYRRGFWREAKLV